MARSDLAVEHEDGLALFISPEWRVRFRESLDDDRRRQKMLGKLHHFRHLDRRFAELVPTSDQNASLLSAKLRKRGAPTRCYLLSNDSDLDGRLMLLDEALVEIVDGGNWLATFVSCLPGRLAYFHDEETENRFILQRHE